MTTSVFDLFTIGIGPSSSHTVGPMRAAAEFAQELVEQHDAGVVTRVCAQLFGSLGATGHGHGSEAAVLLGLEGEEPETVPTDTMAERARAIREDHVLHLGGRSDRAVEFNDRTDLVLHRTKRLPFHANGMTFTAWSGDEVLTERTFYSIGGGFILADDGSGNPEIRPDDTPVPHPFRTGAELLQQCVDNDLSIAQVMWANECARRPENEVKDGLIRLWQVMQECADNGIHAEGTLPGGLKVRRRASELYKKLSATKDDPFADAFSTIDWVQLWALAVNEENASGGRVVTAPTNGAAGIIPAVLHYVTRFIPGADSDEAVCMFLLTAGAIAAVYQQTASISGAEVGCQGEVGTASSMAAGALAAIMGGTPPQVTCAAEIALEHHLGLTCDPVGGLVQIPCIERNAIGSGKAISAARLAMHGDGQQKVSLDQVIKTMMETGADMKVKYKETARGGLAVNIVEC